ncbi:unnamed protein product [Rhizoctonia solani]|uniref:Uncharacterized protein n=1 Tax=Rhizoctonia solani TaxID=456999 RepID=A0A8H3D6S0_9AGAM|nr:unnamed protein product [Rhizoctonia solani]
MSADEDGDMDVLGEVVEDEDNKEIQGLAEELDEPETPQFNDTTGRNTYDSDNAFSDYSRGSWYHVLTPAPSLPYSPSSYQDIQADAPELEGEDGFCKINARDFRKYERWYAEDHPGEDVNVEMLSPKAITSESDIPTTTNANFFPLIPEHVERWGKLRIPDGGDCIRSAAVVDPLSPYGKRDSSFVRYTFQKGANENY